MNDFNKKLLCIVLSLIISSPITSSVHCLAPNSFTQLVLINDQIDNFFEKSRHASFDFYTKLRANAVTLDDWHDISKQVFADMSTPSQTVQSFISQLGLDPNYQSALTEIIAEVEHMFNNSGLDANQLQVIVEIMHHSLRVAKLTALFWQHFPFDIDGDQTNVLQVSRMVGQLLHDLEKRNKSILSTIQRKGELKDYEREIMNHHITLMKSTLKKLLDDPQSEWFDIITHYADIPTIFKIIDPEIDEQELTYWIGSINYRGQYDLKEHHLNAISDSDKKLKREGDVAKVFDYIDALYDLSRPYRQASPILTIDQVQQILSDVLRINGLRPSVEAFMNSVTFFQYLRNDIMPLWIRVHTQKFHRALAQGLLTPLLKEIKIKSRIDERNISSLYMFFEGFADLKNRDQITSYIENHLRNEDFIDSIMEILQTLPTDKRNLFFTPSEDKYSLVTSFILRSLQPLLPDIIDDIAKDVIETKDNLHQPLMLAA